MKRHYKAALEIRQTFDDLRFRAGSGFGPAGTETDRTASETTGMGHAATTAEVRGPRPRPREELGRNPGCTGKYDWVAIKVPPESPVAQKWDKNRADVNKEFPWLNEKPYADKPYLGFLPTGRFRTAEGIEHLFNESKRRELAEDLSKKLVALAEYCDKTLPAGSPN